MRIRGVLGCLMAASLFCGCAARLPSVPDEIALPVSGSASDACRRPVTSPFLRTEDPVPLSTRYQRVAEELRTAPVGYRPTYKCDELEHHKLSVFLGYTGERGGGGPTVGEVVVHARVLLSPSRRQHIVCGSVRFPI